jgi:hypothetical protein
MGLRQPRTGNKIFVMPTSVAGMEVRKDAAGNVHVDLDSSDPFWNDAVRAAAAD